MAVRPAGNHTAFMYVEDDELILWEAMLAWAQDEAPLAELGFTRDFTRLEMRAHDGAVGRPACARPRHCPRSWPRWGSSQSFINCLTVGHRWFAVNAMNAQHEQSQCWVALEGPPAVTSLWRDRSQSP